jgi:uracil-DNA glycosylase
MSKLVYGHGPVPCDVMIIGEAPGAEEEQEGRPFVGKSGQLLQRALQDAGLNYEQVYITNVVKFRPEGNRTPTQEEILDGWPLLVDELQDVQPKYILLLGNTALYAFSGQGGINEAHGTRLARQLPGNPFIFCTYHPAAGLYKPGLKQVFQNDIQTFGSIVNGEYIIPGVG